jgi:hypothetical protein
MGVTAFFIYILGNHATGNPNKMKANILNHIFEGGKQWYGRKKK